MKHPFRGLPLACLFALFMAGLCLCVAVKEHSTLTRAMFTKKGSFTVDHPDRYNEMNTDLINVDCIHDLPGSEAEELAPSIRDLKRAFAAFLVGILFALAFPHTSNACTHCAVCLQSVFGSHCCSSPSAPANNNTVQAFVEQSSLPQKQDEDSCSNSHVDKPPRHDLLQVSEIAGEKAQVCALEKSAAITPSFPSSTEYASSLSEFAFEMEFEGEESFVPVARAPSSRMQASLSEYEYCLTVLCGQPMEPASKADLAELPWRVGMGHGPISMSKTHETRHIDSDDFRFTTAMAGCTPAA
mmetsp:Transcript_55626/g.130330  ORF Transcript_55626/g.130330 Transcript_55626/m.130330 type:complete len:299 (+) Transcript_55626:75-971(+)